MTIINLTKAKYEHNNLSNWLKLKTLKILILSRFFIGN